MNESEILKLVRDEVTRGIQILLSAVTGSTDDAKKEVIDNLFPGMSSTEAKPVMHPYGFVSRAKQKTLSVVAKTGSHPAALMVLGHRDVERPMVEAEGEVMLYNADGQSIYLKNGELLQELKKLTINADGDISITSTGKYVEETDGDKESTIGGKLTEEVTGEVAKTYKAKTTITSTDDLTIEGKAKAIVKAIDLYLGSASASSPFVLGDILKTMLDTLLTAIATHTHTYSGFLPGPSSSTTTPPLNASAFTGLKASPVDDNMLFANHIFGEKGT